MIQVLSNLVENAIKYSPEGGKVTISARHQPSRERVVVSVTDQGIGIAKKDQQAIFDRFHQIGDDVLTEKNKGTGLGLALARDIVRRHGGAITVASEPQQGSIFRVEFPVTESCSISMPST